MSNLSFFSLLSAALLVSYLRNHCLIQDHKDLLLCSSESFIDLALIFRSLSHFELIWYVALGKGPLSFFCMWIFSCLGHHLLKILFFSPLSCLGTSVENELAMDARVSVWTLNSVPLVCMSVFMAVPHCLNYCSFAIKF